jgi:hypothetical protein
MAVLLGLIGPEDVGHLFLRNVRKNLPHITASHPTRSESSFFSPWYCDPTRAMASSSSSRFLDHTK